jgi:hypothetical protein
MINQFLGGARIALWIRDFTLASRRYSPRQEPSSGLPPQKVVVNDISSAEFDAVFDHFRESRIAR